MRNLSLLDVEVKRPPLARKRNLFARPGLTFEAPGRRQRQLSEHLAAVIADHERAPWSKTQRRLVKKLPGQPLHRLRVGLGHDREGAFELIGTADQYRNKPEAS